MTRFTQPANQAAFEQEHIDFAIAAQLNFTSGIVRAHMGVGDLIIGGNTFTGVGSVGSGGFGSVSSMSEKTDARDTGELYVSLSGVDPVMMGKVPQRSEYYGQFASVYFIPINTATMLPLSPAEPAIFEGFMDLLAYSRKQGAASIQVTIKHYDSLFQKTIGLLYTDESHKSLFPTDNFFDQVASLTNKKAQWGGSVVDPANVTPATHGGRPYGGHH